MNNSDIEKENFKIMKRKRISAALAALMMTSSVLSAVNAEETGYDASRLKNFVAYFQNSSDKSSQAYSYDVNCDNSVNILDLIYAKGAVSDNLDIDAEKKSVNYLNSMASTIFSVAQTAAQEIEITGKKLSDRVYSSEDLKNSDSFSDGDKQMLKQISVATDYHRITKWAVSVKNYCVVACITGDDIIRRTGAYPNSIPQKYNVPFSNELIKQAGSYVYDWGTDFNKCISINPSQASLPDYPLSMTIKLGNQMAKRLFVDLQTASQELETLGTSVDGIFNSDDDNELMKVLQKNCYYDGLYMSYIYSNEDGIRTSNKLKWTADIRDNVVYGVIIKDEKYNCTGAYPNLIPYSMNVPYSPDLIEYACDFNKDWKTDFPQYITDNEEQLALAEQLSKISVSELNDYAKTIFTNSITCYEEFKVKYGIKKSDEIFGSPEMNKKFTEAVKSITSAGILRLGIKWDYLIIDGEIKGVIVTDGNITGAFPNSVPNNMSIPYSADLVKYSCGSENLWQNDFKQYAEDPGNQEVPPYITNWVEKATINTYNSNAKSVFSSAYSAAIDCMMSGYDIQDGIISSEDNSEFVNIIKSYFITSSENPQWAVYVSGGEVVGAVYSENTKKYTGAYPNAIPNDCVVAYNNSLASKAADSNYKWGK